MLGRFNLSQGTLKAIKNTGWMAAEKVLSMLLVLVVNIAIARHLGPGEFGQLNYLLAIVALLLPFSSLGLNGIIARELVQYPEKQPTIVATAIAFRLTGAALAGALLWAAYQLGFFSELSALAWGLLLLGLVNLLTALDVIDFWFQARVESKYVARARLTVLLTTSIVKLGLVYTGAPLSAFVIVAALELGLISLAFALLFKLKGLRLHWQDIDGRYGLDLLAQSKWLVLSGIASIIYLKIDQVMLAEMVSTHAVGIYAVASRLSEVWYFFPTALVTSFFPSLLQLKEQEPSQYQARLQRLCDLLFASALALAIIITLIGTWLVTLLFGEQYQQAGTILSLHIWAGIFVFMRALLSKWLLAEHLVFFSLVTHGVGAIINVGLNLWLIPLYQGLGAAVATVVSYAFASYLVLFFHPKTRPMAIIMTHSICFPLRWFTRLAIRQTQ